MNEYEVIVPLGELKPLVISPVKAKTKFEAIDYVWNLYNVLIKSKIEATKKLLIAHRIS